MPIDQDGSRFCRDDPASIELRDGGWGEIGMVENGSGLCGDSSGGIEMDRSAFVGVITEADRPQAAFTTPLLAPSSASWYEMSMASEGS